MTNPLYVDFFLKRSGMATAHEPEAAELLADEKIKPLVSALKEWPGEVMTNHKKAAHPLHRLVFLAELGFHKDDPEIGDIFNKVYANISQEGLFQIMINIPKRFGGSGKNQLTWVLSDAPVLMYAMIKLNRGQLTPEMRNGVDYLASLVRDNGWPCVAAPDLGRFRGPGRKNDPCPYATLYTLKMLSLTLPEEYAEAKSTGINAMFDLWDNRKEQKPYLFAMGTDFKKIKVPFVWYDILNLMDTLSRFPEARRDPHYKELSEILESKETVEGFVPESVYMCYKTWDFGQKKAASPFINAVVKRIRERNK